MSAPAPAATALTPAPERPAVVRPAVMPPAPARTMAARLLVHVGAVTKVMRMTTVPGLKVAQAVEAAIVAGMM